MRRSTRAARADRCSTSRARWSASSSPSPIRRRTATSSASVSPCRSAPPSPRGVAAANRRSERGGRHLMDARDDDQNWRLGGFDPPSQGAALAPGAPGVPGSGANPMEQVLYEVKRTIVGQDVLLERLVVALLARGHILVEGVPGLAKTLAVKSLAAAIGGQFHPVPVTPGLGPGPLLRTPGFPPPTREV